jgi:hypothetical protein
VRGGHKTRSESEKKGEVYRLLSRSFSANSRFSLALCPAFSNALAPGFSIALCEIVAIGCSSLDDELRRTSSECGGSALRERG